MADKKSSDSSGGMESEMVDAAGKIIFMAAVVCAVLAVTLHAAFTFSFGYLYFFAWRQDKAKGLIPVVALQLAVTYFLFGPPWIVAPYDEHGFWNGLLLDDFGRHLMNGYVAICRYFHQRPSEVGFWKWVALANMGFYALPPLSAALAIFYFPKKEYTESAYNTLKAIGQWMVGAFLYLPLFLGGGGRLWTAVSVVSQSLALVLVSKLLVSYAGMPAWGIHLTTFIASVMGLLCEMEILGAPSELTAVKTAQERIEVGRDKTPLTLEQINHHVHVLGGSGFGKSVLLSHITRHHIEHGMGMIFLDLKADQETLHQIVSQSQEMGRMQDLRLFHCGRPEISCSYNVLLRGNPTEIKDKLVGAFNWESEYFKNAAQSFLLTLLKAMVHLRDEKGMSFTLDDVYQATLSSEACLALETELVTARAPYRLQEEIGGLADYLRVRENIKELHGLRTQIKLLFDSEFGELIAPKNEARTSIDLYDCIQEGKIVYLLLDSQRYGESAVKLGKLILQDLKAASARILDEVPKEERKHCAIIVDEFADLATEPFVGFLNRARASKLGIILAHQEMSDLDAFSPTMRDQVMGNTSTTVAFLQKMPESADRLAKIAGTKTTVKRTKQLADEDGLLWKTKRYTGNESEREVEEYIIHPNDFKNLGVGECVMIGKYPKAWAKKTKILPPQNVRTLSPSEVVQALQSVLTTPKGEHHRNVALDLRSRLKKALQPGLTRGSPPVTGRKEEVDSNF